MKWLREHKIFSITVGIVLVLCIVIVVSFATSGKGNFATKGLQSVGTTIAKPFSTASGSVGQFFVGIFSYKSTAEENERLKEENRELKETNKNIQLTRQELEELAGLSESLNYDGLGHERASVVANVIEIDLSNPYIVFTINAGKDKGLKENDIVIDDNGIVGKVLEVGNSWAKVVSVVSENSSISFRCLREETVTGVLTGNGKNQLEGYLLDDEARIIKGDTLITSGIGVYPAGISIGTVKEVDYDSNNHLKVVTVEPTVEFNSLQKVAVVL